MTTQPQTGHLAAGAIGSIHEFVLEDRLAKSLRMSGIGVSEIAERMGVSRDTVSRWINGRAEPRLSALAQWAEITGTNITWLATGKNPLEWAPVAGHTSEEVKRACRDSNPKPSDWEFGDVVHLAAYAVSARALGSLPGQRGPVTPDRQGQGRSCVTAESAVSPLGGAADARVVDLAAYRAARGKDDWSECPECGQVVWHGADCTCGRRWDADRAGVAS